MKIAIAAYLQTLIVFLSVWGMASVAEFTFGKFSIPLHMAITFTAASAILVTAFFISLSLWRWAVKS